jgi:hypothetical protein
MKLSEVIAEIENGSTRTYEAKTGSDWESRIKSNGDYLRLDIFRDGKFIPTNLPAGGFNGNIMLDYDWKPTPEYITWQEALKAMSKGEKIFCELPEQTIRSNEAGFNVTPHMIKYGVWGIE